MRSSGDKDIAPLVPAVVGDLADPEEVTTLLHEICVNNRLVCEVLL